uniref:BGL34 n=1 Tax=Arundo donax TaxID=35708 RepID=A0A0A9CLL9_ARUDO
MCQDDVVSNCIGLSAGVPLLAVEMEENRAASRCMQPAVVSLYGDCVRLVEGDPVLYPVAELLETRLGIQCIIVDDLPIKPSVVLVLQGLGKVPVIQCYVWLYPFCKQYID